MSLRDLREDGVDFADVREEGCRVWWQWELGLIGIGQSDVGVGVGCVDTVSVFCCSSAASAV